MTGIQMRSLLIYFLVAAIRADTSPKPVDINSLPKWQQVFINYTTWSGQYSYDNTLYTCRIGFIDFNQYIKVSFVDPSTHIDLIGYSVLDKVIFNKTDVFQSNDRIPADEPFQLAGKLVYDSTRKYWTYTADVTIPRGKPFSQFKLVTLSESSVGGDNSKTTSIVLGVVFTLAILGVILMAGSMIWSYRKGLLRHIPMSYRTFKNPREERRASFDSREETVHI